MVGWNWAQLTTADLRCRGERRAVRLDVGVARLPSVADLAVRVLKYFTRFCFNTRFLQGNSGVRDLVHDAKRDAGADERWRLRHRNVPARHIRDPEKCPIEPKFTLLTETY